MSELALLRVVVSRGDHYHHHGVALDLFLRARQAGLAGATMLEVVEGLGAAHRTHVARRLASTDAVAYELLIVDTADKLDRFLTEIRPEVAGRGLVASQPVTLVRGRVGKPGR
ncbi:MAG: DUF190 domain-containing protein [Acidimicrobiales bacterium]